MPFMKDIGTITSSNMVTNKSTAQKSGCDRSLSIAAAFLFLDKVLILYSYAVHWCSGFQTHQVEKLYHKWHHVSFYCCLWLFQTLLYQINHDTESGTFPEELFGNFLIPGEKEKEFAPLSLCPLVCVMLRLIETTDQHRGHRQEDNKPGNWENQKNSQEQEPTERLSLTSYGCSLRSWLILKVLISKVLLNTFTFFIYWQYLTVK